MADFVYNPVDKRSVNSLIGKVYGYMFYALLITAIIAVGVGMLFSLWLFGTINPADALYGNVEVTLNSASGAINLLVMLGVSALVLFIDAFVVHIWAARGKTISVPAGIYVVMMGLVLSELVIFVPWPVLGITFAITAGIFGLMFLISYFSKGSLNFLGVLGLGLLIGAGLIALVGWILLLTGALGNYMYLYWIVSLLTFAAIMFITIWDMWRIKQIAATGEMSHNLVLYCAFILYVDFVYLFLRVLRIVMYFVGRKN